MTKLKIIKANKISNAVLDISKDIDYAGRVASKDLCWNCNNYIEEFENYVCSHCYVNLCEDCYRGHGCGKYEK